MNLSIFNREYIQKFIIIILFIFFAYIFINYIFMYVSPFIFGYFISLAIIPISKFLSKNLNLNKSLSTIISIIFLMFVIGVLGTILVNKIVKEGTAFLKNMPNLLWYVDNVISHIQIRFNKFQAIIPIELQETANILKNTVIVYVTEMVGSFVKSFSTSFVYIVPKTIINFILALVSSYFFAKDKDRIIEFFNKIVPQHSKSRLKTLRENTILSLIGYFKAQFIMMIIIGCICIVGLSILKAQYALFLGVLIAIVDALPIFGSGFFYWPWISFSFITGDYFNTVGLSIVYIIVFLTRHIMEPKIIGIQIGIHPLVTLVSIYVGLNVFGVIGIILGPCIAIIIKSILESK